MGNECHRPLLKKMEFDVKHLVKTTLETGHNRRDGMIPQERLPCSPWLLLFTLWSHIPSCPGSVRWESSWQEPQAGPPWRGLVQVVWGKPLHLDFFSKGTSWMAVARVLSLHGVFALNVVMQEVTGRLSAIALLQISSLVQFLTENCCRIFGEEINSLFGEILMTCKRENGSGNADNVLIPSAKRSQAKDGFTWCSQIPLLSPSPCPKYW